MKAQHTKPPPPAATPAAPVARPLGVDGEALLLALFERVRPTLTPAELDHCAGMSDEASGLVRQMARLCSGLGCLVSHDAGAQVDYGDSAGNFQDGDEVASLLWLLGSMAGHADALLRVASMARLQVEMNESVQRMRGER